MVAAHWKVLPPDSIDIFPGDAVERVLMIFLACALYESSSRWSFSSSIDAASGRPSVTLDKSVILGMVGGERLQLLGVPTSRYQVELGTHSYLYP